MEDARSYMAQTLRTMADHLESATHPISSVTMGPTGFTVSIPEAVISVQSNPQGAAFQPTFNL